MGSPNEQAAGNLGMAWPPTAVAAFDAAYRRERRDAFAAAALTGILAALARNDIQPLFPLSDDEAGLLTTTAFRLADAMELARGNG